MFPRQILSIGLILSVVALPAPSAHAGEPDCKAPEAGSKDVPMFSPPLGEVVIGTGRLQFYSAPSLRCAMDGVFVIPKDQLIAYAETNDGWSSVMYLNPRTGKDVSGWVRASRLRPTGTMGPRQ